MMVKHPAASLEIGLGERSYPIHIGADILAGAGAMIAPLLRRPLTAIVTDRTVAEQYLTPLKDTLAQQGIAVAAAILLEPGEKSKSWPVLQSVTEQLLQSGIERQDHVIALGGGVIGDLTGFAAAILRRGAGFIQIPTTLLSQVDSSVGGKTGINSALGKNLIGAFHQPRLVIADVATLATLPRRELLAGYAEVVKYGLIGDRPFYDWLCKNSEKALNGDPDLLIRMVATCCRAKAAIVEADERESGVRALLNLGHTFAHALETAAGYNGSLLHGEAVALGLVLAFDLSHRLGLCPSEDVEDVAAHLAATGLATALTPASDARRLLVLMQQDKKVIDGKLRLILTRGIGKAFIADNIDQDTILATLTKPHGNA